MRQTWEYKSIAFARTANGGPWSSWWEDGQRLRLPVNALSKAKELGDQGWELVSVSVRSSEAGSNSYPGFTTDEEWIFKRPK
jgi:hypothetical protein